MLTAQTKFTRRVLFFYRHAHRDYFLQRYNINKRKPDKDHAIRHKVRMLAAYHRMPRLWMLCLATMLSNHQFNHRKQENPLVAYKFLPLCRTPCKDVAVHWKWPRIWRQRFCCIRQFALRSFGLASPPAPCTRPEEKAAPPYRGPKYRSAFEFDYILALFLEKTGFSDSLCSQLKNE